MHVLTYTPRAVAPDKGSLKQATGSELAMAHGISTGDLIKVIEGELSNLEGKVIRIDGDKITMQPHHKDLKVSGDKPRPPPTIIAEIVTRRYVNG